MTRYINSTPDNAIRTVDITSTPDGTIAYIHLRDRDVLPAIEKRLETMGRTLISQTVVDGRPMLVTSGGRNEGDLINQLSATGALVKKQEKKPFDAWKVRSLLGMGGQGLQLTSSMMKHKVDTPLLVFAGSNMTANVINLMYKAQEHDDPHQLRLLKTAINERLAPEMLEGTQPLPVEEHRLFLREQGKPKATDPVDAFMRKNSVNVGELGLRYIGAFGMAFPASDWPKAVRERRLPTTDKNTPLRTYAGLGSIAGKSIAVTSKIPDPYNPKPHTAWDAIREKYSFLAGGLVEAGAFSLLAYDALKNTAPKLWDGIGKVKPENLAEIKGAQYDVSRSLKFRGSYYRDWLSGIGAAMFVTGYIVRSWAKFGERTVNMPELYAHASDSIAMLPAEKVPQALADTAAYLADHFKKQPSMSYQHIYEKLSNDLYRSHQVAAMPPIAMPINRDHSHASEKPQAQISTATLEHVAPQPQPGMAKTA